MKSIRTRNHKVSVSKFGTPLPPGASVLEMVEKMPGFLAADELRTLAGAILAASKAGGPVVFAIGGHVVKTGCSPYIIDLLDRGIVTSLAMNGAAAIHDAEIALFGETSEDVDQTLRKGEFGMVAETMGFFDKAVADSAAACGLGDALAEELQRRNPPFLRHSLLHRFADNNAAKAPTIHATIGADTVHMSPGLDGERLGALLYDDFKGVCGTVAGLEANGVWFNIGCATLLPEVFMKAVSVAIHKGSNLDGMTTADLDMIQHYRPTHNVVRRPPGRGIQLTGHHEIMIPLLHQLLVGR